MASACENWLNNVVAARAENNRLSMVIPVLCVRFVCFGGIGLMVLFVSVSFLSRDVKTSSRLAGENG